MGKKAVCLLSGGLDSCVTATIAKKEQGFEIYALSFRYGQVHEKELKCAKKIAHILHAENHIVFDVNLGQFGGSSLVDSSFSIPKNNTISEIGSTIPSTYVPARNTIFLSLGLGYAEVLDADAVFIGANAVDFSGYPDCRPEYIQAFQNMADLGTKRGVSGRPIHIKAPLLTLTKKDIIQKGISLQAPLKLTWSCYKGGSKPCGVCDSCLLRLKGFKEAEESDPLTYQQYPLWYK